MAASTQASPNKALKLTGGGPHGIVIAMYYKEHAPPHFQAKYAGQWAAFSIEELRLTEGELPGREISLVLEWAFQHSDELRANWERAKRKEPLKRIEPLD